MATIRANKGAMLKFTQDLNLVEGDSIIQRRYYTYVVCNNGKILRKLSVVKDRNCYLKAGNTLYTTSYNYKVYGKVTIDLVKYCENTVAKIKERIKLGNHKYCIIENNIYQHAN